MNVITPAHLHNVANFRDIGGATTGEGLIVRTGQIYRSGHLADLSEDDLRELERIGIRSIFDLRGPADIAADGEDRIPAGARRVELPMAAERSGDVRALFENADSEQLQRHFGEGRALAMLVTSGQKLVTDPARCADFGALLRGLAEPEGMPAIIHCSAGKDRTGWASSLLLTLLGVDQDQVIEHYLESNRHPAPQTGQRIAAWEAAGVDWRPLEPLLGVHADVVRASMQAVEEGWGGIDGYLSDGLCVDHGVVEGLRAKLLQES